MARYGTVSDFHVISGFVYRGCALAVMLALLPAAAWSQDPVVKPPSGTTTFERLPAPMPTARQLPDGRIEVRWPAVEGAVRYDIRRSVPPAAQTVISRPNPAETTYVDSDVKAGSTYYYVVGAVDSAGTLGLRAGTPPVTATITPGTTTTTTSTPTTATGSPTETVDITVYVKGLNPPSLQLTFRSSPYAGHLERWIFRASATDPTQLDPLSKTTTSLGDIPASGSSATDSFASATYQRWVKYQLVRQGLIGESYIHVSAPLVIPAATTTTTSTTTTAAATSPEATIVTAPPATVGAGATFSVSSDAGSGARWLSLNESIATVDQNGAVTGRAAGSTRVIAATTASDGSLKVVAIPVTVTP